MTKDENGGDDKTVMGRAKDGQRGLVQTSLKVSRVSRQEEASSVPMLREMAEDALKGFANYEERHPFSYSTGVTKGTVKDEPAIALVVVAVMRPGKVEALMEAVLRTVAELP